MNNRWGKFSQHLYGRTNVVTRLKRSYSGAWIRKHTQGGGKHNVCAYGFTSDMNIHTDQNTHFVSLKNTHWSYIFIVNTVWVGKANTLYVVKDSPKQRPRESFILNAHDICMYVEQFQLTYHSCTWTWSGLHHDLFFLRFLTLQFNVLHCYKELGTVEAGF